MNWFWVVFGVFTVVFLGYHFVSLYTSKPSRAEGRRYLLPEAEEEARARYKAAWRKYRRLRIALPLSILGWLPFGYVASAVFRFFQWNTDILVIVVLGWVPFMSVFSWQWAFWQCPRCGYAFKARYEFFFSKALPLLRASNVGGIARPIGTQREFLNSLVCRVTGNLKIHMDGNRVYQELALFGLYFRYGTPHSR